MDLFTGKKLWMPDMVVDGMKRGGDNIFAIYQRADGSRQEISYTHLREQGDELLEKMALAGLRKGDCVAVISALRPWWFSLLYACLLGGCRMVCIDPGVPESQMKSMLRQSDVRAVFTTLRSVNLPSRYEGRIPVYSVSENFPLIGGSEKVDVLMQRSKELPEDTFFILFSSGTTGENRKGVLLPHTTVTRGIEYGMSTDGGVYKNYPAYTVRKRDLMLFPPYHIAGLLCAVYDIYCNTQIIMLERLTPNAISQIFSELKPDNICTVPSMLTMLMKKINAKLGKKKIVKGLVDVLMSFSGWCRKKLGWNVGRRLLGFINKQAFGGNMDGFMIGGSPCDAETMRFFLNMGIDVSLAYGLTELGAPLAVTGKGYYPGTTGRVIRHTDKMDIRVVRPDERGRGEVEILSPYRMISYMNEDDNRDCFTEDGYFKSGDLGYFNEEDCLVICGRAKESMVLRNGEKLLPDEVESRYEDIFGVGELSVFRVPDGDCDAFSIAAVKEKGQGYPDDVVRLHILERASKLPAAYQPKEVYMLHELPMSSSHKVQRFRLTEMVEQGMDAPVSESALRHIDEDGTSAELREILVDVGGQQWKTAELTEGMLLNLDSLQTMELCVSIQEHFGIDMFRLQRLPETFGELHYSVENFDIVEKNDKPELDLSQYPQPVTKAERNWNGTVQKLAKLLYSVKGSGQENIPEDTNFILCSNHMTVLDPGWICSCLSKKHWENTAIVGKSDLLYDKTLRDIVRGQNLVPVDRTGNTLATLDRCRELLEEGWNVLIFPEGTNYENAKTLMPFKEGAARLSIATGKPIIPVHIKGVVHVDDDNKGFLPKLSKRTDVVFGKPIYPEGRSPAEINEELRAAVEAL